MVAPPEDDHLRHVMDTMALYVLDGGCAFEQAIMQRGRGNPLFNFLFELGSKEHTYYVWRLYSFAQVSLLVCLDHMNHMHLGHSWKNDIIFLYEVARYGICCFLWCTVTYIRPGINN